jgi:DNA modification methylase
MAEGAHTQWSIIHGDCIEAMAGMPQASVDAVCTDPPYYLSFMGRAWDHAPSPAESQATHLLWAREALRVLKPGGHLLAFGGTRTYHRLACAIEDAGFEIRDTIAWLYGSGFPKSLDVSKAIDKASPCLACGGRGYTRPLIGTGNPQTRPCDRCGGTGKATRAVVGRRTDGRYAYEFNGTANRPTGAAAGTGDAQRIGGFVSDKAEITAPATPEAEQWAGWGTALKPAHEPIVVARKPLSGTVSANVLAHGTGALNVDGCRIGMSDEDADFIRKTARPKSVGQAHDGAVMNRSGAPTVNVHSAGRWPANVVLDEQAAALLDAQTGTLNSPQPYERTAFRSRNLHDGGIADGDASLNYGDSGGASRFLYVAKASSTERNAGGKNTHPTVKPIALMQWLVRLVTPPGGTVLDPFAGSGTTGIAAMREGFSFVGIEREAEYAALARDRIIADCPLHNTIAEAVA